MAFPAVLLDRRVVIVTGKGGVGKTTVSLAIGSWAASQGKRTLICETGGADQVCGRFGKPFGGYALTELAPNLHTLSITAEAAIEEYLLRTLRFRKLYEMVFRNRVMGPFLDAVPGLHDLVQLGKIFDLERERVGTGIAGLPTRTRRAWDLIVVDAPATGHGLTLLSSPHAMMQLTRAGPFFDNARDVGGLIEDAARTGLVLVSLAEELPVVETAELYGRLGKFQPAVLGVVLNAVQTNGLPPEYAALRGRLLDQANAAGREAVGLADHALYREALQQRARSTLGRLGPKVCELPDLEVPALSAAQLHQLGQQLGAT